MQMKLERHIFVGKSLRESLLLGAQYLTEAGVDESRHQAEQLMMHMMKVERTHLLLEAATPFPEQYWDNWCELLLRKASGEPLQYITCSQWFFSREFAVSPAVLIPRPETELLVEAVLAAADQLWPQLQSQPQSQLQPQLQSLDQAAIALVQVPTIVDVGTGSGAIAVTLAAERHCYRVCASDLSPDALAVARINAERHGVSDHVTFVAGDLLTPLLVTSSDGVSRLEHDGYAIDVLVSNPPYIPADDIAHLQREVRDHEPLMALEGGIDGLDPYRRMIDTLAQLTEVPRIVAFELGIHQPQIVAAMLQAMKRWDSVRIIDDYAGIQRHVIAVRYEG